jgi:hypothetical protein
MQCAAAQGLAQHVVKRYAFRHERCGPAAAIFFR